MNQNLTSASNPVRGVSVIICCYNSSRFIKDTLQHLAMQRVAATTPWEVIIVDNRSSDTTLQVVKDYCASLNKGLDFIIVSQSTPGKTAALTMGLRRAKYEYCIICDHDNWLSEDYVQKAFEAMNADHRIGAIGALGEEVIDGESCPTWFENFRQQYAVGPQDIKHKPNEGRAVYGAGLVLRKSPILYLVETNYEFLLSDRIPHKRNIDLSGGDYELCHILTLLDFDVRYEESLKFKHFITQDRLHVSHLEKQYRGYGVTMPLLALYIEVMRAQALSRPANRYFWIINSIVIIRNMLNSIICLCHWKLKAERKLFLLLDFRTNWYALKAYLSYNFILNEKIARLCDKFSVR